MLTVTIAGLLFGFFGSMPLAGPISVLVFSRGVQGRFKTGFFTSLGASVAESIYAFAAFWGLSAILEEFPAIEPWSRGLAAILLTYVGITLMREKGLAAAQEGRERKRHAVLVGFLVTALNPTLLATWTAATTTLLASGWVPFKPSYAWFFAAGVLVGDIAWYSLLLRMTGLYRSRVGMKALVTTIRVTGGFLVVLGAYFAWLVVAG
jgi:threonine/homoserine/homoserine lactone efflux protein